MPGRSDRHRRWRRLALCVCALCVTGGVIVAAGGGLRAVAAGVVISVRRPWPLLAAGAVAAGLALLAGGPARVRADLEAAWSARDRVAPWFAGAAAALTLVVGLACGTWTAGSADAYGYVSQALLWVRGTLVEPQPLASTVPWPMAEWTLAPLGYKPAAVPGAIVPTYPPGLPLVMAGAAVLGGPSAVFWVVPLLGALAVWLTYLLGRRLVEPATAAAAAWLLMASPAFLFQLVQPMSDVPVTAWWLGALVGAWSGHPLLAGLSASAAVLTRPNLIPLALWIGGIVAWRGRPRGCGVRATAQHVAWYGVPLAATATLLAGINLHWHGHPLATGYGSVNALFSVSNIAINLRHYSAWLTDTQTPLVWLALAAPLMAWRGRHAGDEAQSGLRMHASDGAAALGFAALVLACYLPYSPFAEWWYLRFLLPALPVILLLAMAVLLRPLAWVPAAARVPLLLVVLLTGGGLYVRTAVLGQVFDLRRLEQRYVAAGAYAAQRLPPTAVFFSVQESGSLRLYSGRSTLRFDYIEPQGLDRAVAFLQSSGYEPYFALEVWEEAQFRDRFAASSPLGRLDWPPAAEIGGPVKVRFYNPRDRAPFLAGETIRTYRDTGAPTPRGR